MVKVYGEFYGCSANKADYEIMIGLLKDAGMEIVDSPKNSDINLITTCAVKTPTVNRMIFRSNELTKFNKPLIVAGCLSKIEKERQLIEKINPKASFVGPDSITKIVDVAHATLNGEKVLSLERVYEEKVGLPHLKTNPIVDIVEINSGCLSSCTFCATKLARGNLYSYRPHSIREQIKQSIKEGVKEIWLTSQDSSAYGRDIGTNLPELLDSIIRIDGNFFVRVGMMNPLHFKKVEIKDLINAYKNEKVFKFLHLCVQSGSNKVLKIMKRGYTVEEFVYYVERFREEIPELTLMTDIITGHPGEDEEDHEQTVELIKEIKPDLTVLSKFGARPGTQAAKMGQTPQKVVNERSKELSKIIRHVSYERNKRWLRWEGKVLIDEKVEGAVVGRNYAYKPIVIKENLGLGSTVNVKISKVTRYALTGKLV
ncbi:MAG: tRNA (N(6)-L-threonylcarbamoyladenosine(37)-C(2))-methylthiotransferase [Candidatus Aenigmarchaeota archaeon]|nr:tRNA (N(6)-L-threonylcarbamoyladenosine(37)-C(2))-methylthiotransferase [Candidatus Aenigmarchaeota archaeon]